MRRRKLLLAFGICSAVPFAVAGLVAATDPGTRGIAVAFATLWVSLLPIVAVASTGLQRQAEEHERLASYDPLTELPNRVLFTRRLKGALSAGKPLAVMVADVDLFKTLNDRYGHLNGDEVLRGIAERLTAAARTSDTVARLGGDEFGLILPGATPEVAKQVARRIVAALTEPLVLEEATIDVAVSLGIAWAPQHGRDHDTLLERADFAMYAAKDCGGGAYRIAAPPRVHRRAPGRRSGPFDLWTHRRAPGRRSGPFDLSAAPRQRTASGGSYPLGFRPRVAGFAGDACSPG